MRLSALILLGWCAMVSAQEPRTFEKKRALEEDPIAYDEVVELFHSLTPPEGVDPWDPEWLMDPKRNAASAKAQWQFRQSMYADKVPFEELKPFGLQINPEIKGSYKVDVEQHPEWVCFHDIIDNYLLFNRSEFTESEFLRQRGLSRRGLETLETYIKNHDPRNRIVEALLGYTRRYKKEIERPTAKNVDTFHEVFRFTLYFNRIEDRIWDQWARNLFSQLEKSDQRVLISYARERYLGVRTMVTENVREQAVGFRDYITSGEMEASLRRTLNEN
ncbi:MAG: hypothetical protein QNK37_19840 [Acidobacteriota bacterium]|nr:hypothetical protein [Acidobacteriota bacterium]